MFIIFFQNSYQLIFSIDDLLYFQYLELYLKNILSNLTK